MKKTIDSLCILTAALCLGACTSPESETEATTIETITPTVSVSSTSGDTTGETETTEATEATEGSTGSSSTGEPECIVDEDCGDKTLFCDEGTCEFDSTYCGDAQIELPVVTPNIVLVLDKSGSMVANTWDADADPDTPDITRWFSLYSVVESLIADFDGSMNLGMTLYPSAKAKSEYNVNACLVEASPEVSVGPQHGAEVLSTMPPANATGVQIAGGTPARAGVVAAYEHLLGLDDMLPKFVILVTDGAANCAPEAEDEEARFEVYDEALTQEIADAYEAGITTFVVGIDIKDEISETKQDGNPDAINTFEALNELASAGGMPQPGLAGFYDSKNEIELQEALNAISETVVLCEISLDPAPEFPDFVEVLIEGVSYGETQVSDCETEDGWMFTSPKKDTIRLCGEVCSTFKMTGALDAQYHCPSLP